MSNFIMLVGIPAVGKDTWAREYVKKHPDTVIHSSDDIREELYGDASHQGSPIKVFELMRSRTLRDLRAGKDVIYNATNIKYKDRKSILSQLKKIDNLTCYCKIFVAPVEVCKERNAKRDRVVPDFVYDKMLRAWQTPCEWEGFDKIEVVYTADKDNAYKYIHQMIGFDQKNHHHQYDLYDHCCKAALKLGHMCFNNNNDLVFIRSLMDTLLLHDVGKLFTQTEPDENGNCHYYNHDNIGAYIALACGLPLFGSQLITYHMLPYMKDIKGLETWKKRMGSYFIHWLDIFHVCDMTGH